MSAISSSLPSSLAYYAPCDWISSFCRAVRDLAMKIFNAIKECFSRQNAQTTRTSTSTVAMVPNPRNLIPFYYGLEANNDQVTLQQILSWDDGQLEVVHNYIQWLFPLETPSQFNLTAPVLDPPTMDTFHHSALLKHQLLRSFRRMLTFFGLQMDEATRAITRAPNFHTRAAVWLTPGNHNFLRITRIIHSLERLGLPEYSRACLAIMQEIAQNEGSAAISNGTLRYWQSAITP